MLIDELVGFSNFYGSDPSLVLAGGGNTSAKADGRMWVKGSGTALATITAQGFVEIDLSKLGEIFEKSYPDSDSEREALVLQDLMASRVPGETKRPSVETTLHALFPQTYVLHLHPAKVNGITCSKGGESAARRVIDRDFIWIEQCRPGYYAAITRVACKATPSDVRTVGCQQMTSASLKTSTLFLMKRAEICIS